MQRGTRRQDCFSLAQSTHAWEESLPPETTADGRPKLLFLGAVHARMGGTPSSDAAFCSARRSFSGSGRWYGRLLLCAPFFLRLSPVSRPLSTCSFCGTVFRGGAGPFRLFRPFRTVRTGNTVPGYLSPRLGALGVVVGTKTFERDGGAPPTGGLGIIMHLEEIRGAPPHRVAQNHHASWGAPLPPMCPPTWSYLAGINDTTVQMIPRYH